MNEKKLVIADHSGAFFNLEAIYDLKNVDAVFDALRSDENLEYGIACETDSEKIYAKSKSKITELENKFVKGLTSKIRCTFEGEVPNEFDVTKIDEKTIKVESSGDAMEVDFAENLDLDKAIGAIFTNTEGGLSPITTWCSNGDCFTIDIDTMLKLNKACNFKDILKSKS